MSEAQYDEANAKVAKEWDEFAEQWDTMGPVVDFANKAFEIVQASVPFFTDGSAKSKAVLDFGCGSGLMTARLAPVCGSVVAVDIAPKMIHVLDKKLAADPEIKSNVQTWAGDIVPAGLPSELTPGKFDLVFSGSVLNFCPEPAKVLERLTEVMAPGAYAVHVIFFRPDEGEQRDMNIAEGVNETEMSEMLTAAGLTVVSVDQRVRMEGEEMCWMVGVGSLE